MHYGITFKLIINFFIELIIQQLLILASLHYLGLSACLQSFQEFNGRVYVSFVSVWQDWSSTVHVSLAQEQLGGGRQQVYPEKGVIW